MLSGHFAVAATTKHGAQLETDDPMFGLLVQFTNGAKMQDPILDLNLGVTILTIYVIIRTLLSC